MKKFIKNRVLPIVCAFSILISLCIVPASAATFPDAYRDTGSVDDINALIGGGFLTSEITLISTILNVADHAQTVFWNYVDGHLAGKFGEVTIDTLNDYRVYCNSILNATMGDNFFSHAQNMAPDVALNTMCFVFFGKAGLEFEVAEHPSSGLHRIYCPDLDWWVTDSAGKYPYCTPNLDTSGGNQWIGEVTALDRVSAGNFILEQSEGHLDAVCKQIRAAGTPAQIRSLGTNHKCIWYNRQVLCNDVGQPIVCWYKDEQSATNQERNPTEITTEDGDIVLGDKAELDLENMLMYLPNGSINFIDNFTYDESTKSYHIDSHDTYNYTQNNYYTWNYYINYTSITYIGQTEEYNKYYEVYYELPDGRDSADLTKEELEQLNLSIDVIPYGRSADDTSLRSLYHFDGDTRDSSYWNYCTDFTWNNGSSLTYMDAGVFDGALYLDETEHDFTLTLPSNIGSSDFTLQFRYYQSATVAPQTDSYVKIGGVTIMQFNGGSFLNASGTAMANTPVGTWNEVAVMRANGIVYYYLNGVCIGSAGIPDALSDTITFHFGSAQQTFKYFDELRFLNYALQSGGANYEPTSVPHDTNLTLVLPDSAVPVADEYWNFTSSYTNLVDCSLTDGYYPSSLNEVRRGTQAQFPNFGFVAGNKSDMDNKLTSIDCYQNYVRINRLSSLTYATNSSFFDAGMITTLWCMDYYSGNLKYEYLPRGTYTFSVVLSDGSVYSITKTITGTVSDWEQYITIPNGRIGFARSDYAPERYYHFYVLPDVGCSLDVSYIEVVQSDTTDLKAEWVEAVTIFDKDSLNTPTLAVRTDIDITSYQIGGVRPSVPEKGMVWALVENERIVSIQIYNGQAWESCDGRIWTGQRWIPASSFNIVTLQDMYDIVDATPDFEYIYTESGFWSWWQKSWNAFTSKLFDLLGNGTSGGTNVNPDDLPSVPDDEATEDDDSWSFIDLLVVLKDGTWRIITGVVSTAYDGFSGFVESVSDAGGFFEPFKQDSENSIWLIPLEEGATIWD